MHEEQVADAHDRVAGSEPTSDVGIRPMQILVRGTDSFARELVLGVDVPKISGHHHRLMVPEYVVDPAASSTCLTFKVADQPEYFRDLVATIDDVAVEDQVSIARSSDLPHQ